MGFLCETHIYGAVWLVNTHIYGAVWLVNTHDYGVVRPVKHVFTSSFQSKQLPSEYKQELQGLADGAAASGCSECGRYTTRAIVLANAPGDLKDFLLILKREFGDLTSPMREFGESLPGGLKLKASEESGQHWWVMRTDTSNEHIDVHCSVIVFWVLGSCYVC